jgi:hypothetical protein
MEACYEILFWRFAKFLKNVYVLYWLVVAKINILCYSYYGKKNKMQRNACMQAELMPAGNTVGKMPEAAA